MTQTQTVLPEGYRIYSTPDEVDEYEDAGPWRYAPSDWQEGSHYSSGYATETDAINEAAADAATREQESNEEADLRVALHAAQDEQVAEWRAEDEHQ